MKDSYLYIYYSDIKLETVKEIVNIKTIYHEDIKKIELFYGVIIHLFHTGSPFSSYIGLLVIESLDKLPKNLINEIFNKLAKLEIPNNWFLNLHPFEEYNYIPNNIDPSTFIFEDRDDPLYFVGGYYILEQPLNIDSYISILILEQLFHEDCPLFQKIRENGFSYLTISKFDRKRGHYILGALFDKNPDEQVKLFIFNEIRKSIKQLTIGDVQSAKEKLIDQLYLQNNLHSPVRFLPFIWHLDSHLINLENIVSKINLTEDKYLKKYLSSIKYDVLNLY